MATADLSARFEQRIREIVQPLLDEAVDRMMGALMGAAGARGRGRGIAAPVRADGKVCNVAGCGRPMRSKGYCAAHYQAARKYGWPMPAPAGFNAPVRRRGRPPKSEAAPRAPARKAKARRGRKRRARASR